MDVMQTFGKIAGGWGLLLLLSSPIAWRISTGSYALIEAGVGVALLVVYFATNRGLSIIDTKSQANQRASFFWVTSAVIAVAALVLIAGLNFIVAKKGKPVDLTNKKIYSLAPQTLAALKGLKEPVRALAFIETKHLAYDSLDALFKRFAQESDQFTYAFKDPKKSLEENAKYNVKEGQTTVILVKGKGETETHTALSVASEQEMTNAILKLNASGTQKVYFLTGHAEYPLAGDRDPGMVEQPASLGELKKSLEQEGYAVETLDLTEKQNQVPPDAAMLAIAHASTPFSKGEISAIDLYLSQGGRLLYFADWDADSGLEPLLAKYGIQVEKGVVADALNPQNPFQAVGAPSEHEVAAILKQLGAKMLFDTARGLTPVKEGTVPGVTTTPVILASPKSWIETTPENPDPSEGERLGAIPLVMASTIDTKGAQNKRFDEARVLVFGDSAMILDVNWGQDVIRNLVLNAFGWTSTQIQKITIRPPDRDISTVTIDDGMMQKISFLSVIALPQLLIALGIAIRVSRRAK
ncbi:MAG: GldG family protein [Archangiaceae bacterium]|nr:GldG family protein [Archangiaceae bacterium]